jgi:hypothetical protein
VVEILANGASGAAECVQLHAVSRVQPHVLAGARDLAAACGKIDEVIFDGHEAYQQSAATERQRARGHVSQT